MDDPWKVVELAFAWGFGIVFGVGFAVWAVDAFLGVNLLTPFRKRDE